MKLKTEDVTSKTRNEENAQKLKSRLHKQSSIFKPAHPEN